MKKRLIITLLLTNILLVSCTTNNSSTNNDESSSYNQSSNTFNSSDTFNYDELESIDEYQYEKDGNNVYFGSYPQTLVNDTSIIQELNDKAGSLPSLDNLNNWNDYNYYKYYEKSLNGNVESYMYYQDIDYDNNGSYDYRGVYFTSYRPYNMEIDSKQEKNGYLTNNVYWFKYESIKWDILEDNNGRMFLVSNKLLDTQDYYPSEDENQFLHNGGTGYANNYELSNIRKWLNDNFYNTAFNESQKKIIDKAIVDNSLESAKYVRHHNAVIIGNGNGDSTTIDAYDENMNETNDYVCNNTNDKIFLLSAAEVNKYYENKGMFVKVTDYTTSQGIDVMKSDREEWNGNGSWSLRTPYNERPTRIASVYYADSGGINDKGQGVTKLFGIRPALYIYEKDLNILKIGTNNYVAGIISSSGAYNENDSITINATLNEGYSFDGWYYKNELLSKDLSYTFKMPNKNVYYEARFKKNKYKITIDNQVEELVISGITSGNEYEYETEITLSATNNSAGSSVLWTRSDGEEYIGNNYSFKVPANDLTITITTSKIYAREGNKIYFGTYPQTKVDATKSNGLSSIIFDSSTWTSYKYYIDSEQVDFMYYKDVDIDNNGTLDYRGVYFTQYRPMFFDDKISTEDNSFQDDHGYLVDNIYWFRYEPIEWDILTEANGKALILANLILDSQEFYLSYDVDEFNHNGGYGYANNYELSNIRKWLNENFYNTAFSNLEKELIQINLVDNSASTFYESEGSNSKEPEVYECNNTNDNIFLLSSKDVNETYVILNTNITDYTKAQGYCYFETIPILWWLRSPGTNNDFISCVANQTENNIKIGTVFTVTTIYGVRPACYINL